MNVLGGQTNRQNKCGLGEKTERTSGRETNTKNVSLRRGQKVRKKSVENMQTRTALNCGAQVTKGLLEESKRRSEISTDALAVQERNSLITLIAMLAADLALTQRFIDFEKCAVLRKM